MAAIIVQEIPAASVVITPVAPASIIIFAPAAVPDYPVIITGTGTPPDPAGLPEGSLYIEYS